MDEIVSIQGSKCFRQQIVGTLPGLLPATRNNGAVACFKLKPNARDTLTTRIKRMAGKQIHSPVAAVHPHAITQHGDTRLDNYFWLREKENPEVRQYLEAENAWTAQQMRTTEALQEQIYREIVGRIQETDTSAPVCSGDWLYYSRTVEGAQYRIYCRKPARSGSAHTEAGTNGSVAPVSDNAGEEILLDANQAAEGFAYFQLGVFAPSPDHSLLAYSVDTEGDEDFTVCFKDLRTGELLSDRIANTYYSLEWAADNRTVFYNVLDAARRPYKVFRHTLGAHPSNDVEVYHETDERFEVDIDRTRDRAFLLLDIHSHTTSETRALPAGAASSGLSSNASRASRWMSRITKAAGTSAPATLRRTSAWSRRPLGMRREKTGVRRSRREKTRPSKPLMRYPISW
jgi:protease II